MDLPMISVSIGCFLHFFRFTNAVGAAGIVEAVCVMVDRGLMFEIPLKVFGTKEQNADGIPFQQRDMCRSQGLVL